MRGRFVLIHIVAEGGAYAPRWAEFVSTLLDASYVCWNKPSRSIPLVDADRNLTTFAGASKLHFGVALL
jgi:hypothetical protein